MDILVSQTILIAPPEWFAENPATTDYSDCTQIFQDYDHLLIMVHDSEISYLFKISYTVYCVFCFNLINHLIKIK